MENRNERIRRALSKDWLSEQLRDGQLSVHSYAKNHLPILKEGFQLTVKPSLISDKNN